MSKTSLEIRQRHEDAAEALRSLDIRKARKIQEFLLASPSFKIDNQPVMMWAVGRANQARQEDQQTRTKALAMVSWLLSIGMPNNEIYRGMTPLMEAAAEGDFACVRRLVAANPASVKTAGPMGSTALHWAAKGGRPAICRFLVEHGAALELRNHDGRTPLHCAAERLRMNTVAVLHELGADWTGRDATLMTPLELLESKDKSLARLWKNRPEHDALAIRTAPVVNDAPRRSRRL